jgi:hypothetical protein
MKNISISQGNILFEKQKDYTKEAYQLILFRPARKDASLISDSAVAPVFFFSPS